MPYFDVNDDATIGTAITPTIDGIGARYRHGVFCFAVTHGQTIEVTTVFINPHIVGI